MVTEGRALVGMGGGGMWCVRERETSWIEGGGFEENSVRCVHRQFIALAAVQPVPLKACCSASQVHCMELFDFQISHDAPEKTSRAGGPWLVWRLPRPIAARDVLGHCTAG